MTNIERRDFDDDARDARVAAVLSAAAAPVEPGPLPGEEAALVAFGAVHRRPGRKRMRSLVPFKTGLAAAVGASVLFTGGVAAAAGTGSLPGAAQQTAKYMLATVGITVPGPNDHAADHPAQRGTSADGTTDGTSTDGTTDGTDSSQTSTDQQDATDGQGKGSTISQLATDKNTTGVQKGQTVSTTASGGKSQAGLHGQATSHPTSTDHPSSTDHPTADNPPTGDQQDSTDTEDSAATGQSTAGTASSGHSAGGTSHRP